MTSADIKSLLDSDRCDDALTAVETLLAACPGDASLLFLKGKTLWRLGRRSEACNAYALAAEVNPDGPAARALEHARDIDSFFNPDIFNP